MTPAGDYNVPFLQRLYTGTRETTGGEKVPTFTNGDTLFGAIDLNSSQTGEYLGSRQGQQTGTIRFRGYPAIDSRDRFRNLRFGETYIVTGVRRGHLEMIVDVTHYDGVDDLGDA